MVLNYIATFLLDMSDEDPFASTDSNEDPNYRETHSPSDSSESEDPKTQPKRRRRNEQIMVQTNSPSYVILEKK